MLLSRRKSADWATSLLSVTARSYARSAPALEPDHLGGVPRKLVIFTVRSIAYMYANVFNSVKIHNLEALQNAVLNRPRGTSLITVSNHMST